MARRFRLTIAFSMPDETSDDHALNVAHDALVQIQEPIIDRDEWGGELESASTVHLFQLVDTNTGHAIADTLF